MQIERVNISSMFLVFFGGVGVEVYVQVSTVFSFHCATLLFNVSKFFLFINILTVPGAVPKTDIGSFEVSGGLPNRDVYIYWQHIPDYLKNGDNFEYKIISVEENGHKRLVQVICMEQESMIGICFCSYWTNLSFQLQTSGGY